MRFKSRQCFSLCLKLIFPCQVDGGKLEHPLYLAPSLVVVEIHSRPCVLPSLQGIDKLLGDGLAKANIVAAAAPEPAVTA